jgi:hypothetical protein
MPDTRERVLLARMRPAAPRSEWLDRLRSRIKLALRRAVVATAGFPLGPVYGAIYKLHVWYAVRKLTGFRGTRAVYATRGIASEAIVYGVSDIDLVTVGDWSRDEHARVLLCARRLMRLSPLYDSTLSQQVHTLSELHSLSQEDYFFQSRFNAGRTQWKLLAGEDVFEHVVAAAPERLAGGYYMELRNAWLHFIMSAFGQGPTARDEIFRNSICFKAVAETLNAATAIAGEQFAGSRAKAIAQALSRSAGEEKTILERMIESARRRHSVYAGDIVNDALRLIIPALERSHAALQDLPAFRPASAALHIDANGSETLISNPALAHARFIVGHVKARWAGYRSASMIPGVCCFALDHLLILLEVDPARLPHASEIQELCRLHARAQAGLRQRISLHLLLPHGAYQLDLLTTIEMWRVLLCPAANPDIFTLAGRPEFTLDGSTPVFGVRPLWPVFANDLVREELNVRRSAMANADLGADPDSLEISRHLWRHLQLEIVTRSTEAGTTLLPLTPAAVERALAASGVPANPVISQLREAYTAALEGKPVDVMSLVPSFMTALQSWQ